MGQLLGVSLSRVLCKGRDTVALADLWRPLTFTLSIERRC